MRAMPRRHLQHNQELLDIFHQETNGGKIALILGSSADGTIRAVFDADLPVDVFLKLMRDLLRSIENGQSPKVVSMGPLGSA